LVINSITASGDFAVWDECSDPPVAMPAGNQCRIDVAFHPTVTGNQDATVTIVTDAPGSPHTVPLSGTGTDFTLEVSPSSRSVTAGGSTTYALTVTPVSGFSQAVSLACSANPSLSQGTCTISPNPVTPVGGNAATATATVTTMAPSMVGPNSGPGSAPRGAPARWLWLLALGTLAALAAARKRRVLFTLGAALLLMALWTTCGRGGGGGGGGGVRNPGTSRGTYALTFTGTCSGVSKSITAQLTVN
jgi:hypothetical protein